MNILVMVYCAAICVCCRLTKRGGHPPPNFLHVFNWRFIFPTKVAN